MSEGSRFYDLRQQGMYWSSPRVELPERITSPSGESLERVNLPNASLCADFLVTSDHVWAGIAVAVTVSDLPGVWRLFDRCSPSIVRLVRPDEAKNLDRYGAYLGFGWVEVIWHPANALQLIEVQTNEVLWYARRPVSDTDAKIVLLGLENLPSLMNEPEQPLTVP